MMHDSANLDHFDLKMLSILRSEGRLTNQELADRVGLSVSQCSRRRNTLERSGVIRGYRADIDPAVWGPGIICFVNVSLNSHSQATRMKLRTLILANPAVLGCHSVTGTADYLVKVRLADLGALNDFLFSLVDEVEKTLQVHSMVVLEVIKDLTL